MGCPLTASLVTSDTFTVTNAQNPKVREKLAKQSVKESEGKKETLKVKRKKGKKKGDFKW